LRGSGRRRVHNRVGWRHDAWRRRLKGGQVPQGLIEFALQARRALQHDHQQNTQQQVEQQRHGGSIVEACLGRRHT